MKIFEISIFFENFENFKKFLKSIEKAIFHRKKSNFGASDLEGSNINHIWINIFFISLYIVDIKQIWIHIWFINTYLIHKVIINDFFMEELWKTNMCLIYSKYFFIFVHINVHILLYSLNIFFHKSCIYKTATKNLQKINFYKFCQKKYKLHMKQI